MLSAACCTRCYTRSALPSSPPRDPSFVSVVEKNTTCTHGDNNTRVADEEFRSSTAPQLSGRDMRAFAHYTRWLYCFAENWPFIICMRYWLNSACSFSHAASAMAFS